MGLGMVLVVADGAVEEAIGMIGAAGFEAAPVGRVIPGEGVQLS
jgi:phosphoribosylaminoimidazole (AIR) synthetase